MKREPARVAGWLRAMLLAGWFLAGAANASPASEWRSLPSLAGPRQYHTATLLPDGNVLFVGGIKGKMVERDVSLYEPLAGALLPAVSALHQARFRHTATLLPDGAVLIAGGEDARHQSLTSAELYDPATKKITRLPALSQPRKGHTATLLENGDVLFIGGGTNVLELYEVQKKKFKIIGNLEVPRKNHTATLLPDGRILVAGGGEASAEWFSPAAGTHGRAPLSKPRAQHTATLLPDGKVLLAGGGAGAEIFDPVRNTASPVPWEADLRLQAAALLPDGTVLLAGGTGPTPTNLVWSFNPSTSAFTPGKPMLAARAGHTATFLADGHLLVYGGSDAAAEVYVPGLAAFQAGATLNAARSNHTATLLPNGEVLLAGGSDAEALNRAEVFDPAKSLFRQVGSLKLPRSGHTATLLPTGQVLIVGGVAGQVGGLRAELYYPQAGAFNFASNSKLHERRAHHTATLLADGRVLIAGGENEGRESATAEIFESMHGAFKHTGEMASPRAYHSATRLPDGSVLLAGGRKASGFLPSAEIYFPARGVFERAGDLQVPRAGHAAVLLGTGKVLILGGEGKGGKLEACEIFDPVTKTFSPGPSLAHGRKAPAVAVLPGGDVLITGGGTAGAEVYSSETNSFSEAGALTQARQGASATLLLDGRVLVAAGEDGGRRLDSAEWALFDVFQDEGPAGLVPPELAVSAGGMQPGQVCTLSGRGFSSIQGKGRSPYPPMPMISPRLGLQALESGSAAGGVIAGPGMDLTAGSLPWDWSRSDACLRFTVPADLPAGFFAVRILKNGRWSPAQVMENKTAAASLPDLRPAPGAGEASPAGGGENEVFWSEDFNGPPKFRPAGWKDASQEKGLEAEIVNCGNSCARVSKHNSASWGRVLSPLISCDLNLAYGVEVKVKNATPGVQWNVGIKEEHTEGYWPLGEYSASAQTLVWDLNQWVQLKGKQDFRIQINLLAKPGMPQQLDVDFVKVIVHQQVHAKTEGKLP